ncbi:kynureninase [Leucobacter luti]|uniref:Kynureninase n=1 Tax=Leucobacter luti TaxID=340320 RepID=A0A4Q7TV40_9MICO|nr:aminotransferase class V-fold PLP-dependent enzyme [Leucobacter luti]MBL3698110.1 aminotransferase class V-fold PLP-dependent enzyme [Leucobacter luti]RZT64806.1 kynureninase [Leucobacter luti]
MTDQITRLAAQARELDDADPLAGFIERFAPAEGVSAYLDGNSLGRPLRDTGARLDAFVRHEWGSRLIRSWDEQWLDLPTELGDRIGAALIGAAPGQTIVGDSTTVLLYKLMSAAVAMQPGRDEVLIEANNFPTDRFVAEGIAHARGLTLRQLPADPVGGITVADIAAAVTERTALVVLSHVDYRSGAIADMRAITAEAHRHGALVLWDLCHSVGVLPVELDAATADFAVGCTYKYLNGGPGSPAFAYVNASLQELTEQPVWGWMGAADVFGMRERYEPAPGIRRFLSGTPAVLSMLPLQGMLELIEEAGIAQIRAKSVSLTALVVTAVDELLAPRGVALLTSRDPERRGGHVTIGHEGFADLVPRLWEDGVIPDFRRPDGIRIGLSPLSTTHAEALRGVVAIAEGLTGA